MVSRDKVRARGATVRIGIVAVDRGLSVAVGGLVDVFAVATHWWSALAGDQAGRFDTVVLGADDSLRTFTGRPVAIDATLEQWEGGDVLICSATADPTGVLEASGAVVRWLRKTAKRPGLTVASVCTGAFFLAEAGLLSGLRATTNPLYARAFARRFPNVRLDLSRVLVDEGPCITAGTVSAGVNLGLHFVEKYAGAEVATLTAKSLAVDKNRETQSPYLIPPRPLEGGDDLAVRAQRWIEEHYADPNVSLATIASATAASARTVQRHFVAATGDGPMDYLRRVRLEAAKRLLEATRESVDRITWRVGYRDARSFARLFDAYVALTPTAYREKFGMVRRQRR